MRKLVASSIVDRMEKAVMEYLRIFYFTKFLCFFTEIFSKNLLSRKKKKNKNDFALLLIAFLRIPI